MSYGQNDLSPLKEGVSDIYHGITITDPYRHVENLDDSLIIDWLKQSSKFSQSKLSSIPGRQKLIEIQVKNSKTNPNRIFSSKITKAGEYFYLKKTADKNYGRLFKRDSLNAEEKFLLDPKLETNLQDYSISYLTVSKNGHYVAIGLTKNGDEVGIIKIFDVVQGELLDLELSNVAPASLYGIQWLPDESGIIYLELPVTNPTDPDYFLNTKAVLYKLDSIDNQVQVIVDAKNATDLGISSEDFPVIRVYDGVEKFAFLQISGSTPFKTMLYCEIDELLNAAPNWKILYTKEHKVKQIIPQGNSIIYMSALQSPNFKICQTNFQDRNFNGADCLVEEDNVKVITDFDINKHGLFWVTQKNGVQSELYVKGDVVTKIETPNKSGRIIINSYNKTGDDLIVGASGWLNESRTYSYDFNTNSFYDLKLNKENLFSGVEDMKIQEIEIRSYDNTLIPVSIIKKKGTEKDKTNRVLFYGYGSYGSSVNPFYSTMFLEWVKNGGILVVPHVRGGGEKGVEWHNAGKKTTKSNTWKDLISTTEYMINEGYTNNQRTVVWGTSAGGILAGRAITERPDLFKVCLLLSPFTNTLRSEIQPNGANSIKEFGTVEIKEEFDALLEMDSYHSIKKGVQYPAVFISTGFKDGRVVAWDPAKFYAKLKNSSVSENPILLQLDFDAGHGSMNSGVNKTHQLYADFFSFAYWQTGHPDFQPK